MGTRSAQSARIWHALTFAIGTAALVLQFALILRGSQHLGDTEPSVQSIGRPDLDTRVIRFFSYFTVWCNILGTAIAASLAVDPRRDGRIWRALRLDSVTLLFVTGVVHWFVLRPLLHLHGADYVADKLLHVVVPVMVVLGWAVFGPRGRIASRDLAGYLVLPVLWLLYTLVRGAIVDWYPYPFIDVNQHGYAQVTVACVGVAVLTLGLGWLCRWLDPRLPGVR